jgi:tRNA(Ile)-lysidine synthase
MACEAGAEALPLQHPEAERLLAGLDEGPSVLAVSGGSDSTALMGLAAERRAIAIARGFACAALHVAVVDHGLRVGSATEAERVSEQARQWGLPCAVLRWTGDKPARGLQEAARKARYGLLAGHARCLGANTIVTAHTLDDQAETLLMRLAAGSGPGGMAGMRQRSPLQELGLLRPFLSVPKQRLVATCIDRGWRWTEDPSNADPRFARVRWRRLAPLLEREGLDAQRLAAFARRCAEADEALELAAQALLAASLALSGQALRSAAAARPLDMRALSAAPAALRVRALGQFIAMQEPEQGAGPQDGPGPRLSRLEALAQALDEACLSGSGLRRTLGGLVLTLDGQGLLHAAAEPPRRRGLRQPCLSPSLGKAGPRT